MNIKCPNCDQEIPGKECPDCGEMTPVESKYCINCGTVLQHEQEEIISDDNDFDFENRVLCSDGTCTGIIIDGKCSECGKPG
jgi:hypothetical protein